MNATTMGTRKITLQCVCCLTKNDLVQVTSDKQKILSSFLDLPLKNFTNTRVCINCNSTLSCVDKFRHNSLKAQTIMKNCTLKNTFLSSVTDESVNSAFDTILNWMNDVTVILKYYMTDLKDEKLPESEPEELHEEYEYEEVVHEEEMFVDNVHSEAVKKEEMEIEVLEGEELEVIPTKYESDGEERDVTYANDDEVDDEEEDYFPRDVPRKFDDSGYRSKFTCDVCGKKYAVRADLMYHMNVHAGMNPFTCDIDDCEKSYPHPRTLKVHQREVHNIWNGQVVKPPPPPKETPRDPAQEQKLEELKDENFKFEEHFVEGRKGMKRPYQCKICSRYYNKTEFQYHRYLHLGIKPFKCTDCDKAYSNPFELGKHFRKQHETDDERVQKVEDSDAEEPTILEHADDSLRNTDEDTKNYRDLEKYFVDERRGCRRAYECPECKKLYSRGELKYHLNTHKNVKPYVCAIEDCDRTFASPRDMRVHALKFHKIKVKPVKDYSMKKTRNSIKKERKSEGMEQPKINVVCTVCGKSVRKKHFREHYQTHIKQDYSCPYEKQGCEEVFRNKAKLTSHIQAKHDAEYTPASVTTCMCEHCGKRLTKAQLKYHMNLHLGLTPYACEYPNCHESYRSPNLLRQHIAGYHLKQMRYKCHYCSKRFNTKEEQDQHKQEDCGVKTATCHLCGRTMNKFSLKNHLLIHTGEKSWICDYEGCGKAFLRRDKLQQHKKLHSTEDHYQCPYCQTGFKYKSWLDTHIEKKHPTSRIEIQYEIIDN